MSVIRSRELFRVAKLTLDLGYQESGIALLEHLLKHLPSHVAARCLLGENFVILERWADAREHFESVLGVDPINLSALRGMGCVALAKGSAAEESEHLRRAWELYPYDAMTRELLNKELNDVSPLSLARILTASSLYEEALPYYEAASDQAMDRPSEQPMVVLLLAEALWRTGRTERARSLLETLIAQQPTWVKPKLILADIALGAREDALGVALLHDASALDSSLLVAQDLFGQDERYDSFVSDSLEVPAPGSQLVVSAPEVVEYLLGKLSVPERLPVEKEVLKGTAPSGAPVGVERKGTSELTIGEGLGQAPYLGLADDEESDLGPEQEVPVRLILSSRGRLVAEYGDQGYRDVDAKLEQLSEVTAESTGHEVMKMYVDDHASLAAHGLDSVDASEPRQIARLIQQLESELRRESKTLRSLLIIGGDSVIPFHRVANPADDEDGEVLSDWPYAAQDGNSLLTRFSVGRMPGGQSADAETLLPLIENAIRHHGAGRGDSARTTSSSWLGRVLKVLGSKQESMPSVGYSAEIWAEASRSVFQTIGDGSSLMVSPPLTDYDFLSAYEEIPTLGYFNLHGFRQSPYWYGHGESEHGSLLLPVALTPLSVSWANAEEAFIYTEACYGADLSDQYADGSIALNFLTSGALGFVGSTAMSYGVLAPPLSGADLLGRYLWEGIVSGLPTGCALRRARAAFIRTAATEQGYLDGEDQKTLLSFVLYGDPSLSLEPRSIAPDLDVELEVSCPPLACHWRILDSESVPVSRDLREKVQRTLPSLSMSGLTARPLFLCNGACSHEKCATHPLGPAPQRVNSFPELIVTSRQEAVSKGGNHLQHVVKVTVSAAGDVTKVLMSRGGICVDKGSRRE